MMVRGWCFKVGYCSCLKNDKCEEDMVGLLIINEIVVNYVIIEYNVMKFDIFKIV